MEVTQMRLKDIPAAPAYLVFHDAYDNGAMEVWTVPTFGAAQVLANNKQTALEQSGNDECGGWKAYEKLPRVKVYAFRGEVK
jgi:hypothetical protein